MTNVLTYIYTCMPLLCRWWRGAGRGLVARHTAGWRVGLCLSCAPARLYIFACYTTRALLRAYLLFPSCYKSTWRATTPPCAIPETATPSATTAPSRLGQFCSTSTRARARTLARGPRRPGHNGPTHALARPGPASMLKRLPWYYAGRLSHVTNCAKSAGPRLCAD